ncbi:MAG: winged helix-turn-helix transcriptional regulator [Gammaproteobacteria bacterium]|nr:winged helix-turn-helix transcriptional regulator [Gammaproteobacteria bacterium]
MNADHNDMEITLPLLQTIAEQSDVTQRNLSQKLNLALGLTNNYLKRCVKKGLIKVEQTPANRYLYYLTPQGFSEKSRLTTRYLSNSFHYYRQVKQETEAFVRQFRQKKYCNIALVGNSELAEIALLVIKDTTLNVKLFGAVQKKDLNDFDVAIVSDMKAPQKVYDKLTGFFEYKRIFFYKILGIIEG